MNDIIASPNETASAPYPSSTDLAATNAPIHLQVGERRFTTTRSTLAEESGFFKALLSGRWNNALADGSYFIDADPALFEHILAYLRRGVFPLFFDVAKGHNYHRYLSLLEEARYFQIPRLEAWLEDKRYLQAVEISVTATEYKFNNNEWKDWVESADTTLEYHVQSSVKKILLCPQRVPSHSGNPQHCRRVCGYGRDGVGELFDEEPCMHVSVIRRELIFKSDVCVAREEEERNRVREVALGQGPGKSTSSNQVTSFALF